MQQIRRFFANFKVNFFRAVDRYPFYSFLGLLALLLILIVVGNILRTPAPQAEKPAPTPTTVSVYQNGVSPAIELSAKIEKSGVMTIMAQTSGVVQSVPVIEGMAVKKGSRLATLTSNYQGASAPSVTRQLTQKTVEFNKDTYNLKKETIANDRTIAQKRETQSDELRDINRKSLEETDNLIKLNENILNTINEQIRVLQVNNVNASDSAFLGARQGQAQLVAGLNQLRSARRVTDYSTSDDQEGADIDRLTRDNTLKQLEIQEKSLDLTRDIDTLTLKLNYIAESLMYPSSPCPGIVERVFVKPGQMVSPGTPIAIIKTNEREITAIVTVPQDIATKVSRVEVSTFRLGDKTLEIAPRYISSEPTEGNLYTILYSVPGLYEQYISDGQQVSVSVPLGAKTIMTSDMFIPLDAVYQTQDSAFVYVAHEEDGVQTARVKEVTLGKVSGQYVQVTSGLENTDVVITTRGLSDGDLIATE